MKISQRVLNTEFAGGPQSVKAPSEDTARGDGLLAVEEMLSLSLGETIISYYVSAIMVQLFVIELVLLPAQLVTGVRKSLTHDL